jgi:peptide deformylase
MAILPIYNCFHPILRKKTEPITVFDDSLIEFVDNMFDTMLNTSNGVGLAANQIGVSKSIIVIDTSFRLDAQTSTSGNVGIEPEPLALINPIIEYFSDEKEEEQEGCLSIPTYFEKVLRSKYISLQYNDVQGNKHSLDAEGFLARVIQHEVDHLNGILIFDRISAIKRALAKSKLKKIEQGEILGDYKMILPDDTLVQPVVSVEN